MENTPLADLSGELRNLIYEYALYEHNGIVINLPNKVLLDIDNEVTSQGQNRRPLTYPPQPALLQTCRAVRKEAMILYYAVNHLNIFMSVNGWDDDMDRINGWLHFIGYERTKYIEHAILRLERIWMHATSWSAPQPLAWKQFSDMLKHDAKIEVVGKATYVELGLDKSIELTCRIDKRAPPLGDALVNKVLKARPDFKRLFGDLDLAPIAMGQELSLAIIGCFAPTVYLSTLRDTIVDGVKCGLEKGSRVVSYRFRL